MFLDSPLRLDATGYTAYERLYKELYTIGEEIGTNGT